MLTWSLVLATYNRADILAICVELAVAQSRAPQQVVVVDASDGWADSRSEIAALLAAHPSIELVYEQAEERSLTVQRNQGLRHATSDVVFLIDDDALMYPGCAERVMEVYERDVTGAVVGAQSGVAAEPPGAQSDIAVPVKQSGQLRQRSGLAGRLQRTLVRRVLLFDLETTFIPYSGGYPDHPVPDEVRELCEPTRFMSGYRMTYRTDVVRREGFDATLRSYCPGEDTDASYRISQHGALVTVPGALICHHRSASGRVDRRRTAELGALNRAYFVKRNADPLPPARRRYYRLMVRRLAAELIKDAGSRRWDLPQVRGFLAALAKARRVFATEPGQLGESYVETQEAVLGLR